MTVVHSVILASSLWRVFPIIPSSQIDMPSLKIVALDKEYAFTKKKTIHTKSSSSSSLSFLDITSALLYYIRFIVFSHITSICVNSNHHLSITRFHSNQYTSRSIYLNHNEYCSRNELINTIAHIHLIYLQ